MELTYDGSTQLPLPLSEKLIIEAALHSLKALPKESQQSFIEQLNI